jgi:hypothetical protein
MRAYEIDEGFRDWFSKDKKKVTGPQLMNYADTEMIQSVDRRAEANTKEIYNLQSRYGDVRLVYVKYPNNYEFKVILPGNKYKSFKFRTASELHKLFHRFMETLQNKNGT